MSDRSIQAVSELVAEGMTEAQAQDLVVKAFTAGDTRKGAEKVEVQRTGPWTWRVRDSTGYESLEDTYHGVLLTVARRISGSEVDAISLEPTPQVTP